ncbi:TonB-dependent receptor [Pseudoxanthomonas sp.]|uniref:TonB-dependent receptor n=1 Tax=Pseudoxanthomonas sp. TaxID=1871049 RepID=UPI00262198DE|nr:TonB-dependent receptor [Pseudoxanthomonas sp.]WDS35039.1 MAG: TonB-dependent receptor [Pseudoxanthomonas sp.]
MFIRSQAPAMGAKGVLCLAITAALWTPVAGAQVAEPDGVTDPAAVSQEGKAQRANETTTLKTVTVTAEHRSQDIQKVATAITAVNAEALKEQGKVTLQDAIANVPGVEFQQSNTGGGFYVRGIGARLPGVDSPVSTFYDGVFQARSELTNLGMLDVERIEVLRGPQGTLYGRNNSGGTVNIITHDPILGETSGDVTVQAGNYSKVGTSAAFNVPLTQTTALRVALGTSSHDGYLSNGLNDEDSKSARVKWLWKPNEDVKVLLTADYARNGGKGTGNVYLPTDSRGDAWYAPGYSTLSFAGSTICGETDTPSCEPYQRTENKSGRAELDWNLGWSNLTFIAAHQTFSSDYRQVYSYLLEDAHTPVSQSSTELRLSSKDDSPVTWVGGLYWLKYDASGGWVHNYSFNSDTQTDKNINETAALFGQATIPLRDTTRLTIGGRYTRDKYETNTTSSGTTLVAAASMKKFTYKAGLEQDVGDNTMLFANLSTGYRQGGVGVSSITGEIYTYAPETITALELGWKGKFLDNSLVLNTDLFWYRYKGYQLSTNWYPDPSVAEYETRTANVPGTTLIGGIEVEGRWLFTAQDSVDFSAAYSYNDYAHGDVLLGASSDGYTSMGGREMARMPKWKLSAGYSHIWDLANGGSLTGRIGAKYSTKYVTDLVYFTYLNPQYFVQKAYSIYDANLSYDDPTGRYTVSVYGNNLSNEAVIYQANAAGTATMGSISAPRTYGVSFTARF